MGEDLYQRSFGGGELAPVLHARADTAKYASAAKTIRNFVVRREGGVSNRPGLRFTSACKTATKGTRLMRFTSSDANQSVLIEMGAGYFRFYKNNAVVNVAGVLAWSAITNYVIGDLVVSGGVNYYCFAANLNQVPPNAAFWWPLTGTIYEIPTSYSLANLPQWNQSGNVITLTNPNVAPMELTYISLTRWTLTPVDTHLKSLPPTAPVATGGNPVPAWDATVTYQVGAIVISGGIDYVCILSNLNQVPPNATYWLVVVAGALTRAYAVTTVAATTLEESVVLPGFSVVGFLDPIKTAPNKLSWTAPAVIAVDSYNVYCDPFGNGVFGFIGEASTNAFSDPGLTPDFLSQPPIEQLRFTSANNYPTTAAYYQQRRAFANTLLEPDAVFMSKTGFNSSFGITSPLQDDDALKFRLAGNNHHPIRHMVPLKTGLVLMTDGGEWSVTGASGPASAITPNSLAADQETYVGCDPNVRPVVVGSSILYVQTRGSIVRQIQFNLDVEGLDGKDMTVFATHLFDGHKIVSADFQQVPDSIIWCVRDDGVLLGLTYIPEQDVWGWHRHDTTTQLAASTIEDVCIVPEDKEDGVYVIVARTLASGVVRYIERLNSRIVVTFNTDAFFVDAGLSYHGAAASVFSGLNHLEGEVVAVVADGVVIYNGDPAGTSAASFKVTGGVITLPAGKTAVDCHIGLAIRYAELETLAVDVQGSNVRGKKKAVHGVTVLIDRSSRTFKAGRDAASLTTYAPDSWETPANKEFTGQAELQIGADWNNDGRVFFRQVDPLPLTIIGVLPNVETGG